MIFQGTPAELAGNGTGSLTGAYLGGHRQIETPKTRRKAKQGEIVIRARAPTTSRTSTSRFRSAASSP